MNSASEARRAATKNRPGREAGQAAGLTKERRRCDTLFLVPHLRRSLLFTILLPDLTVGPTFACRPFGPLSNKLTEFMNNPGSGRAHGIQTKRALKVRHKNRVSHLR